MIGALGIAEDVELFLHVWHGVGCFLFCFSGLAMAIWFVVCEQIIENDS